MFSFFKQTRKMSSKSILEAYLDRDLVEAVGETNIAKIINAETKNRLSKTQIQILSTLIQRQHDNDAMEEVRGNIECLELRNVVDAESSVQNLHSNKDLEIIEFITKLEKLNALLEKHVKDLDKSKSLLIEKCDGSISNLINTDWFPTLDISKEELVNVTNEIHEFNKSIIK